MFGASDALAQLSVQLAPKTYGGGYHITCFGASDGRIDAIITNGQAPFTYVWTGAVSSSASVVDVPIGSYGLFVTDNNGDTASAAVSLIGPDLLEVSTQRKTFGGGTDISAKGLSDGQVGLEVRGGTPPYTYEWSSSDGYVAPEISTKSELREAKRGLYTIMVTGMNGCAASASISLTEPSLLELALTANTQPGGHHISCFKGNDGSIDLSITGGAPPYKVMWSNGAFSQNIDHLSAGVYEVKVQDANGAGAEASIELTQPDELSLELNATMYPNGYHVSCHDCYNANILSSVNGGSEPYSYEWESANGIEAQTANLSNGGEDGYGLLVRDAAGCKIYSEISLKIPERDDWQMSGNANLQSDQFLGTTDETDLVLKANGQAQLRLGADGVTEVMGALKAPALSEADTTWMSTAKALVIGTDGILKRVGFGEISNHPVDGPCAKGINADGSTFYIPTWVNGPGKIWTSAPCPANVGIGTDDPVAKLDVRGQTYSQTLSVNTNAQDAKVTIKGGQSGTQNQFKALEVQNTDGEAALQVFNNGKTVVGSGTFIQTGDRASIYLGNQTDHYISAIHGKGLSFSTYGAVDAMVIEQGTGRVMIGDRTIVNGPHTDSKLSVDGKIIGRELFIHNEQSIWGWPDYVFDDSYDLRSIEELKEFIESNNHLPGVADAKTIQENGIGFSSTAISLLEKVEELSLYVIQLNEKIKELEKKLEDKY